MGHTSKEFTPERYVVSRTVEPEHHNFRLDKFMQIYITSLSREFIKSKIEKSEIIIEGRKSPHRPSTKVHHGETITMYTFKGTHDDVYWRGEKVKQAELGEFLYEDEELIAINKPPYMSTHPTGSHLFNVATVVIENRLQAAVHSFHRIDRETSGLLLLAKTPARAQFMTRLFEDRKIRKAYFLIGVKKEQQKIKESFIANERLGTVGDDPERLMIKSFPEDSSSGKTARTTFQVLFQNDTYVLALAFPHTGRQHQIRVHAKAHGFPLVGDKNYISDRAFFSRMKDDIGTDLDYDLLELPRQALHAAAIHFFEKDKPRQFICPLPTDLIAWIDQKKLLPIEELHALITKYINNYFKET